MKKSICVFTFILLCFGVFAQESQDTQKKFNLWGSGQTFKLTPITDGILLGTGALIAGSSIVYPHIVDLKQPVFDGNILDKSTVNDLDRIFMQPYSKTLHTIGTVTMLGATLTPAILAFAPAEEWMTICTMYAETLMFAYGIKEFAKIFIPRARPYMYFEGYPQEKVDDGDWCRSFPSGHTTPAFAGAAFSTYVFFKYFPDSPWKWAVAGGSYALAIGTGILRICSGNHFLTDVLTGAAIGTVTGFVIPWIHTFSVESQGKDKTVQMEVTPMSLGLAVKF